MRHRILTILALSILLLSVVPVNPAANAKATDFNATLAITGIGEGQIIPVPPGGAKNGLDIIRWLVRDRPLWGIMSGDINGSITIIGSGNLDTNQAGNIHGDFTIDTGVQGDGKDLVTGKMHIKLVPGSPEFIALASVLSFFPPEYQGYLLGLEAAGYLFAALPVNSTGTMVMQKGTDSLAGFHAQGKMEGPMVKALLGISPLGESHVVGMLPSEIAITGTKN